MIYQFIERLIELNVHIELEGDKLIVDANSEILTPELIGKIRNHKLEIINILKLKQQKDKYNSIPLTSPKQYYHLSSAQKRLYLLQQMDLDSTAYNMPKTIALNKETDKSKIEEVFRKLIQRHESLRTSFDIKEEVPVQFIHDQINFKIEEYDIKVGEENAIKERFVRKFDLTKAPLIRAAIVSVNGNNSLLMIDMHHIISDGVSQNILEREFLALYSGEELVPLSLHYKDYSEWQNSEEQQIKVKKQENYWIKKFEEEVPVLNLPVDMVRPVIQSHEGATVNFVLSKEETQYINFLTQENGLTLYMSILSVFSILLSKLSGQEDIIVGTPIVGRNHIDLENIVGMFVNTLAMRNEVQGDYTLKEFLEKIKQTTIDAYENQDYQFDDLVDKVLIERDTGRNPIFDVMFNFQSQTDYTRDLIAIETVSHVHTPSVSKFDLTLTAVDQGDQLMFNLDYCTKLFKPKTIERYIGYFKRIVDQLSEFLDKRLSLIEIVTVEEKQQLLYEFNDTQADYPKDKTIHQLFEEQVEKTPEKIAVAYKNISLTYNELNVKSNQLSHHLRRLGIESNDKIALLCNRSEKVMIGIFSILKSGGVYVPIDPSYPESRINYIIENCDAKFILSDKDSISNLKPKLPIVFLDDLNLNYSFKSNPNLDTKPTDSSYIIYTSGSTGNPKGVKISHNSVVNLLYYLQEHFPVNENASYLLKTSFCFDVSISELFAWILGGGKLSILGKGYEKDSLKILESISKLGITHINFVPAVFKYFLLSLSESDKKRLAPLKYIMLAGEALRREHLHDFKKNELKAKIINLYGPTESTVYASSCEMFVDSTGPITIGKPIANTAIYILDKINRIQPLGVPGELCISGDGLALGYLNNKELTDEKFIQHPYKEGEHLYRTGDLARWLSNGDVEFLGRIDHQVKIRGFRIELGEIENVLFRYDHVKECVVTVFDVEGDKYLCAYVVLDGEFNVEKLSNYLSLQLPDYMVPSYFIELNEMPLTKSGKIDRKALPRSNVKAGDNYIAPTTEIEKKLVEIWSRILNIETQEISISDNFFKIGGNSLKITLLLSEIHKVFSVRLLFRDVFKKPILLEQAKYICKINNDKFENIKNTEKREYYPITKAQRGIYYYQLLYPDSISYNFPMFIPLIDDFDVNKLEDGFNLLIRRHEIFRTSIFEYNNEPYFKVHDQIRIEIPVYRSTKSNYQDIFNKVFKPFQLKNAPLVRLCVLCIEGEQPVLIINMNHIISDEFSQYILAEEFNKNIHNEELPKLRYQFKDVAVWQSEDSTFLKIQEEHKKYWLTKFQSEIPEINLPFNSSKNIEEKTKAKKFELALSKDETEKIKEFVLSHNSSVFIAVLTIFYVWLYRITRDEDIIIGTPVSGRYHENLNKICGMFVNTLALRNYPKGEKKFTEFFNEVNFNFLNDIEHQWYSFDELVGEICKERIIGRNPIFDIFYTFNSIDLKENPKRDNNNPVFNQRYDLKFDMDLSGILENDEIILKVGYKEHLFKPDVIEYYKKVLKSVIDSILNDFNIKLKEITLGELSDNKKVTVELEEDF